MSELNKKLAEFVWGEDGIEIYGAGEFIYYRTTYNEPDREWNIKRVPDFEHDPNACFEHLEPELYRRGFRYQLTRVQDGHKAIIFGTSKTWAKIVALGFDEKPATAFSKAVEELMEKK